MATKNDSTTVKKSDSQLQRDVLDELKWDTRVRDTEVGVVVKSGVVTLVGTVDSWAKRIAAAAAAHRVSGVLDVANDLEVELPGGANKSDTEIAEAVRQALAWDVFVPQERIQTTVSEGVVTLDGNVDHLSQRYDAERAIRNLSCVKGVVNWIVATPPPPTGEIRKAIEDALERHAAREAQRIQVIVEEGTVTLFGRVDSWADHDAVLGAARSTRGVRSVADKLQVGV